MRGICKLGLVAVALAVVVGGAARGDAMVTDNRTTFAQPSNALVMPFDATADWATYLVVSNLDGVSLNGEPQVITHWTYWSENCDFLADAWICLTLNDTALVSPKDEVVSIGSGNEPVGDATNLSGERGIAVVTAYATDEACLEPLVIVEAVGPTLVDDAIVGVTTRANTADGYSFGNDAIGLGVCAPSLDGCPVGAEHTVLPAGAQSGISVLTFNPSSLESSSLALLSLSEQAGEGDYANHEVGPNSDTITAAAEYFDNMEMGTSLPDVEVKCATFGSMGGSGGLIPDSTTIASSGFLHLDGVNTTPGSFVYAVYGQAIGSYGGSSYGKYLMSTTLE
jgi:hypothetical protein